jgi:hypothetical protein
MKQCSKESKRNIDLLKTGLGADPNEVSIECQVENISK